MPVTRPVQISASGPSGRPERGAVGDPGRRRESRRSARARRRPAAAGGAPVARAAGGASTRPDRCRRSRRSSANCAARATTVPGGVKHRRTPVEDQLVLAADLVAEHQRGAAVRGPRGQHPLARVAFARVPGRRRQAGDDVDPGGREVAGDRIGVPDVLADGDARRACRTARRPAGPRRPGSTGPRRRPRSWAETACGRPAGPVRRPPPPPR